MPKVYRKVILGHKTNMFTCENCLDANNQPQVGWVSRYVQAIVPGDGNPGVYEEAPLEKCDWCFSVDADSREEMYEWSAEMDRQQWEEEYHRNDDPWWSPDEPNPQELK